MKRLLFYALLSCWLISGTEASDPVKKPTVANLTWHHLLLDTISPSPQDLKVLIISSRSFSAADTVNGFLRNDRPKHRELTYFIAFCHDTCWSVVKYDSFQQAMDMMNRENDYVFFIHGHGKGFPQVLKRSAEISQRYNVNMVTFDWPSQNGNFNRSLNYVRQCTNNLEKALDDYADYKYEHLPNHLRHSLFTHSLGGYQLIRLILNDKTDVLSDGQLFNTIVLNAPAIKHKKHNRLLNRISANNHLYVMLNKNDWVLNGATLLMFSRQLGTKAEPPLAQHVNYFDFTKVAQKEHTYFIGAHQFEDTIPHIRNIYYNLLHGHPIDPIDKSYLSLKEGNGGYFVEP